MPEFRGKDKLSQIIQESTRQTDAMMFTGGIQAIPFGLSMSIWDLK